ncbi:MAG: hypothetical protein J7521_07360 [Caulobacter sp.]|nr:hypothetical protein [Caulobacter sp.]
MAQQSITEGATKLLWTYVGAIFAAILLLSAETDTAQVLKAIDQIRPLRDPVVTEDVLWGEMGERVDRARQEAREVLANCADRTIATRAFPDMEGVEAIDYSGTPIRQILADVGYQAPGAPNDEKTIRVRTPDVDVLREKVCADTPDRVALICEPAGCQARVRRSDEVEFIQVPWRDELLATRGDILGPRLHNGGFNADAFVYDAIVAYYDELKALTPVEAEARLLAKRGDAKFEVPLIKLEVPCGRPWSPPLRCSCFWRPHRSSPCDTCVAPPGQLLRRPPRTRPPSRTIRSGRLSRDGSRLGPPRRSISLARCSWCCS